MREAVAGIRLGGTARGRGLLGASRRARTPEDGRAVVSNGRHDSSLLLLLRAVGVSVGAGGRRRAAQDVGESGRRRRAVGVRW